MLASSARSATTRDLGSRDSCSVPKPRHDLPPAMGRPSFADPSSEPCMPSVTPAIIALTISTLAIGAAANAQTPQRVDRAEHHQFTIENFRTESGVVLPKATVVYGTYGRLNADRSN